MEYDGFLRRVEYNSRPLLEENVGRLEKYFPGLRGIPRSIEEINLKNPTRKDLVGLVALYALENPDGDITGGKLSKFAGLQDPRMLNNLINRVYGLYRKETIPDVMGSTIGTLLLDAGFLDSNLFEKISGIEIGYKDITKQIRIPSEIDETVAWLAGMITISNYIETFDAEKRPVRKSYDVSFRGDDKDLVDLEFMPLIENLFNYSPYTEKPRIVTRHELKEFDVETHLVSITPRSVVSYFRDVVGIRPEQENRGIPFENETLTKAFIGGVIDRCGYYYKTVSGINCVIGIPSKYPKLAEDMSKYLGRKKTEGINNYTIYFANKCSLPRKIEEMGLRNPKWYMPRIERVLSS